MKRKLFTLAQWTWGLPQTLIGSAVYLANRKHEHFDYKGARVTAWNRDDGLSLGKFIFVPKGAEDMTKHEFGHSMQSIILGPAYLFLVGAPSILWNRLPYFIKKRNKTGKSYYSPIFERSANKLGGKRK